ncbi:hypothetical protein [Celeribacter halophilus]|uniref:hypothetical protein n=1 Tax=Celeribacter halophilus TaxID=576117 RepID=UPI003A90AB73
MEELNQNDFITPIHAVSDISTEQYLRALHPAGGRGQLAMFAKLDETSATRISSVEEVCMHLPSWLDCTSYVSLNRFIGKRCNQNVVELNALYLDLDFHTKPRWHGMEVSDVEAQFLKMVQLSNVPMPSVMLHTGRGLSALWLLKPLPGKAVKRWSATIRALVKFTESFGSDSACTDPARIFRLPGTINEKSGKTVRVSWATWKRHDFDTLSDRIFVAVDQPTRHELKARKAQRAQGPRYKMPIGLTQKKRFAQIQTDLDVLRDHFGIIPEGIRNTWLHLYGVCLAHQNSVSDIAGEIERQARNATPGLSASEVRAIIGVTKRQVQVRLALRYNYAGDTIAKLLSVDSDMARALNLKQIISKEERKRRKAEMEAERRRAQGTQPRAAWNATHMREKNKPWQAIGISRSTWYRRQKAAREKVETATDQAPRNNTESKENSEKPMVNAGVRLVRARYRGDRRFLSPLSGKQGLEIDPGSFPHRQNAAHPAELLLQIVNEPKSLGKCSWPEEGEYPGLESAGSSICGPERLKNICRGSRLLHRAPLSESADQKTRPGDSVNISITWAMRPVTKAQELRRISPIHRASTLPLEPERKFHKKNISGNSRSNHFLKTGVLERRIRNPCSLLQWLAIKRKSDENVDHDDDDDAV